jgi:hypothetical protein
MEKERDSKKVIINRTSHLFHLRKRIPPKKEKIGK